jgi:curli biogenesis system outer membrane secretion channel CsgG
MKEESDMKHTLSIGLVLAVLLIVLQDPTPVVMAQKTVRSKPLVAVLEFKSIWVPQGSPRQNVVAEQDLWATQLVKSGKFRVVEREQLQALMTKNSLTLSGNIDAATAIRAGKLLGVQYLLTGSVTEYGFTDKGAQGNNRPFVVAMSTQLIDTSTGEIVWADEVRRKVSIEGFGGGVDDDRMFDKVMKPSILQLTAKLKAAKLKS